MIEIFIDNWYIILLFFTIAILYASVGFGGGSSYLAILALTDIAYTEMRATSLLCNILVVSGNVLLYHQQKNIDFKKIIPLVILSIPLAYFGGYLKITQNFFFILLGFILLIASIIMWISKKIVSDKEISTKPNLKKNLLYGGFIGFISGMVGIGGGIFLAPLLHLTNWDSPKKIAATASIFILVNSLAGLGGQISNPDFSLNWNLTFILLVSVFIGGQIGNRISSKFFTPNFLKKATAILIAFVSLRILWKNLL
ncbi:MAG: sulfite exporter TauE/SafE family protein [Flavobacteriia bacterium]|nr:sulfite exporter TauE/SafE family protein [Flavobacteriia bacterium]OIP47208.1 MAG: hypothetical protein AUK46_05690 [Flavobacteriaceae bacterium CG2_30_31_66]PIV96028.1 MAG: hypothetical protein COW43_10285 [Flavobacteriaceae bacterium CG17_big_fil_post_rev_8_21_14_2_50_31_13]PIX14263.1 MAG: hypothetical protein COZ74_03455 [Flavobacteriaceae bacterium CG_4_8_14_3_um_filter_31_8]PIY13940.1 MAG: hypothetical protein COZ16_11565 [Flavobacteriaceae bacterium CG_4_10_14_3_um_filter_31_253]PIZ1